MSDQTQTTAHPPASSLNGFDPALVRKYNQPGPRYTSYPTAPHFRDDIPDENLLAECLESSRNNPRISLYIHLPFCETACWFCGCTRVISRDRNKADIYLDYLEKEIALTLPHLAPDCRVTQIHFGGGTPTFLTPEQIERLGRILRSSFTIDADCERGVEIDPRRLSREHISALAAIGCNRASLGVQDLTPEVQQAINRIQPMEQTAQAIEWLRAENIHSINVDVIYGLPLQTVESFHATMEALIGLAPDRFAVFSYAHVPWIKPAQKIFDHRNNLPDADTKLLILQETVHQLTAAKYQYIGMDHFAREDDELSVARRNGTLQRNFQGYSTRGGVDICALGMSAISQTANTYRQNLKEIDEYYSAIDTQKVPVSKGYFLSHDDHIRRTTIMQLMCNLHVDFDDLSQRLNINFADYFKDAIQALTPLRDDGLVHVTPSSISVTQSGRFLLRNIAMPFDAYLYKAKARHSKTV